MKITTRFAPFFFVFAILVSSESNATNTKRDILGKWNCGPVVMKGPQATVTASWSVNYLPDYTYIELTSTQVNPTDRPSFSTVNRSVGRWEIKGKVLETQSTKEEFISATDPFISKAMGQKVLEEQVTAKPISQSRILKLNAKELRTFPINAKYKEAEVTTTCMR